MIKDLKKMRDSAKRRSTSGRGQVRARPCGREYHASTNHILICRTCEPVRLHSKRAIKKVGLRLLMHDLRSKHSPGLLKMKPRQS